MNLFPPNRTAVFVMGAACGFAAGWFIGSGGPVVPENNNSANANGPVRTAPAVEKVVVPVRPAAAAGDEALAGAEGVENPAVRPVPPPPAKPEIVMRPATTADEAGTQMSGILSLPDDPERLEKFSRMLEFLTSENFSLYHAAWMNWLREHKSPVAESPLYNRRAGQVAGPVVVGQRTGEGPRDLSGAKTYVRDQFLGWIETDPVSAERWLDSVKQPEFRVAMEEVWEEAASAARGASR